MRIYILDSTAVISLGDACDAAGHRFEDISEVMTELSADGQLTCPPLAIRRCNELGREEAGSRWLRAASGHFRDSDESWEHYEEVLDTCADLVDPDDDEENAQVSVLALAIKFQAIHDVVVVTDQWVDTPLNISQATAANQLSITAITVAAFIEDLAYWA